MRLLAFLALIPLSVLSQVDTKVRNDYRKECLEIADFIKQNYNVQCHYNYHHFNSSAYRKLYDRDKAIADGKVRIGGFNVLHPGMSKTRYKDYRKIALIINDFDVVGVTELLPLVSADLKNNKEVVKFLKRAPKKIEKLKERIAKEKRKSRLARHKAELESLKSDLARAKSLYRMPGYLKILHALHQLKNGREWALLLSPRGEATRPTDVQELVGFFYRASKVKPKVNQYCREIRTEGRAYPVACIPNMGKKLLGQNKKNMFSRRPFLAEFISGRFSFIALASHVVYSSPDEEDKRRDILQKSFGVDHYDELGVGINAANYARFAEVKVTLDFMREIRQRFNQKDVILVGDMNLESGNPFWERVLPSFPGGKLYVKEKTSLTDRRYDNGKPTNGVSSDYDHFIFDQKETEECANAQGEVDAKVWDFYGGRFGGYVRRSYRARHEEKGPDGRYFVDVKKFRKIERKYILPYKTGKNKFETIGAKRIIVNGKTIRIKGIVTDEAMTKKYIDGFYDRVLDSQLSDDEYFRFFSEVISDHKPIYMDCSTR